jgi:hypothetical protein
MGEVQGGVAKRTQYVARLEKLYIFEWIANSFDGGPSSLLLRTF